MTKQEAFQIALPKWPQLIINGEYVTKEQALEIIRRADRFFQAVYVINGILHSTGNDTKWATKALWYCGYPVTKDMNKRQPWNEAWGIVSTEYVFNEWCQSSWVCGPHGWCNPSGKIAFCNNVGKWPNVEDIYHDLCTIAEAFTFVDMHATLMSGEECQFEESNPLVSFHVHDGIVDILDEPLPKDMLELRGNLFDVSSPLIFNRKEEYFDIQQFQKWGSKFKEEHPEFF